jgi:hypothetical protein
MVISLRDVVESFTEEAGSKPQFSFILRPFISSPEQVVFLNAYVGNSF